jgi:hypothetical protein
MNQDVEKALFHLEMADIHISKYLDNENKLGLITNIRNTAYNIKQYYNENETICETNKNK